MSNDYLQDAIDGADAVKDLATGADHVPFDFTGIDPDFKNAEHIENPGGGPTVTIDSKAGDNKSSGAGDIELIHFGRVYLDSEDKFAHEEYDDTANLDFTGILGGRAGMHRAALQRELLLQAGYMRSLMWAMEEAGKAPPDVQQPDGLQMIDQLMGMVGDLAGSAGAGQNNFSTLDLNPLIDEANALGKKLDKNPIVYVDLHEAGIELHELRGKYRKYLEAQHATLPKPAAAPTGLLGSLPLVGEALKNIPVVGDVLEWGNKIVGCSFGLVARIAMEMHMKMEVSINAAARDMSIKAIRDRSSPVFAVWWKPLPDDDSGGNGGNGGNGGPTDPLTSAMNSVENAVDSAKNTVDSQIKKYTNVFTIPDKSTPGDAFIDQAFRLNPAGSLLDRSETMAGFAARALCDAIDEDAAFMPAIVRDIATYVFQLVTEFVRSVYDKLLVVGRDIITDAQLAEGGRTHLVSSLIEWPLKALDLNKYIDAPTFTIPLLSGGTQKLSLRGLFERAKDLLIEQLGFMDAAVQWSMKDFASLLNSARGLMGANAHTMEPYLALVPTLHAVMFRNLLLPFWTAMINAFKSAVGEALAPVMKEIAGPGGFMHDVYNAADAAGKIAQRVKDVKDFITDGMNFNQSNIGSKINQIKGFGDDLADPTADPFAKDNSITSLSPFPNRVPNASAVAITQADRDKVEPDLKWSEQDAVNEDGDDLTAQPQPGQGGNGGAS